MLILPGRSAKGQRPSGPVQLNRDSPQALALRHWWPIVGTNFRAGAGLVDGAVQAGLGSRGVPGHGLTATFDGSTTYANTAILPTGLSGSQPWTLAIWIRHVLAPGVYPANDVRVVTFTEDGGHADATYDKAIEIRGGGVGTARVYAYDGGVERSVGTTNTLDNVPHRIIGTFDGATLRIYCDGRLENSQACSSTYAFASPQIVWSHTAGGCQDFTGQLWDTRVYARCLSAAEVWADYDPATRWDLYWHPSTRAYAWYLPVAGGSFNPAWAAGSNQIVGWSPC